jgi:hypothetical protein
VKVRRFRDLFVLRDQSDDGIVVNLTRSEGVMKQRSVKKVSPPTEYGVHLDVPGRALIAQANERIKWHEHIAAVMTEELKALTSLTAGERPLDVKQILRRTDLETKVSAHREYARFLTFVRDNLERGRRYRLALTDLSALEIMPKGTYR